MNYGKLYGIGMGPGEPELITLKGANTISRCKHVFVPKSRALAESTALRIGKRFISEQAEVHQLVFPMTSDQKELDEKWNEAAVKVLEVLETGEDACFLTLGDPLLYSTYTYLVRCLRALASEMEIETIPGVMALNAAAALTEFTLGEGKERVEIIAVDDDLSAVGKALASGGNIVLMKIGKRLQAILDLLEDAGQIENGVFVSRAGQQDQYIETDLRELKNSDEKAGYMSIMLIHAKKGNTQ